MFRKTGKKDTKEGQGSQRHSTCLAKCKVLNLTPGMEKKDGK